MGAVKVFLSRFFSSKILYGFAYVSVKKEIEEKKEKMEEKWNNRQ